MACEPGGGTALSSERERLRQSVYRSGSLMLHRPPVDDRLEACCSSSARSSQPADFVDRSEFDVMV